MFEFHTDSQGNQRPIAQLSDPHLLNIIRNFCRIMQQCTAVVEYQPTPGEKIFEFVNPEVSHKIAAGEAREKFRFFHLKLQPYVVEATLRGMGNAVTPHLQKVYRRNEAIPTGDYLALAPTKEFLAGETDDENDRNSEIEA